MNYSKNLVTKYETDVFVAGGMTCQLYPKLLNELKKKQIEGQL